jgi:hypothetical protein
MLRTRPGFASAYRQARKDTSRIVVPLITHNSPIAISAYTRGCGGNDRTAAAYDITVNKHQVYFEIAFNLTPQHLTTPISNMSPRTEVRTLNFISQEIGY